MKKADLSFKIPTDLEKEFESELWKQLVTAVKDQTGDSDLQMSMQEMEVDITPSNGPSASDESTYNKIHEQCKLIESLSLDCTDFDSADSILTELTNVYKQFYKACSNPEGFVPLSHQQLHFKMLKNRTPRFYGRRRVVAFFKLHSQTQK